MKYLVSLFALFAVAAPSFATHFGISQIVVPVQTVQTVQAVVAHPVVVQQVHVPVVQHVQQVQVQVQAVHVQAVQAVHVQRVQAVHSCGVQAVRVQSFRQPVVQQRSVTRSVTRIR